MASAAQHRVKKRLLKTAHFIGLFLAMCVICIPGLWVVLNSFRPTVEIMAKPPVWIPESLNLDHYRAMFGGAGEGGIPVWTYFRNSLIISVTSTLIALLVGMGGGYAFARYKFKGKAALFVGLMATRAVPGVALSLPLFIIFGRTGLIDGFFRQGPKELAEAAEIDGCTRWQAFWKVEFPVARAGIASAGIFAFLTSWNEYALASQLTRSTTSKTMPVGLLDFTSQFTLNWGGMCALAVLMIIPALLLTFLVQKHLIAGLTFGGVKG